MKHWQWNSTNASLTTSLLRLLPNAALRIFLAKARRVTTILSCICSLAVLEGRSIVTGPSLTGSIFSRFRAAKSWSLSDRMRHSSQDLIIKATYQSRDRQRLRVGQCYLVCLRTCLLCVWGSENLGKFWFIYHVSP